MLYHTLLRLVLVSKRGYVLSGCSVDCILTDRNTERSACDFANKLTRVSQIHSDVNSDTTMEVYRLIHYEIGIWDEPFNVNESGSTPWDWRDTTIPHTQFTIQSVSRVTQADRGRPVDRALAQLSCQACRKEGAHGRTRTVPPGVDIHFTMPWIPLRKCWYN